MILDLEKLNALEIAYSDGAMSKLALENINIFEIVTTRTELTIIINKKDLTKSYNILEGL